MSRKTRLLLRLWRWLTLSLALALAMAPSWTGAPDWMHWQEQAWRDRFARLTAQASPPERIVVVDIDEDSLQRIAAWPWPSDLLATMVEQLLMDGAERVALDMVLTETTIRDAGAGVARLAAMASRGDLVLAQAFDFVPRQPPVHSGLPVGALPANGTAVLATGVLANPSSLAVSAKCAGNIGFLPDADGKLRRLPWRVTWQGLEYPTLAAALHDCGAAPSASPPLDDRGFWHLGFREPAGSWLAIPAWQAMDGNVGLPRHALVLVGSSALGLSDRVATPLRGSTPGVEVHAHALARLLQRDVARPAAWVLPALAALGAILLFTRLHRARRLRQLLWPAVPLVLIWALMAAWHVSVSMPGGISGMANVFAVWLALGVPVEWAVVQRQLQTRGRILSRYVSESVLTEILEAEAVDPLQPRRALLTVLVADLEGYTALSARLPLETAASLTRQLLERMSQPIWAHRGTLDKYLGDGLLAFWGAPLPSEDHADLAIAAAQAIIATVAEHNETHPEQPAVRVRVGLATGIALVGDLGTRRRSSYTAIGDCMNLAARLQEFAKEVENDIILCPETARHSRNHLLQPLGKHALRGLGERALYSPVSPADCDFLPPPTGAGLPAGE